MVRYFACYASFLRSCSARESHPEGYILSARFGLIPAHQPISYYDCRMTPQQASIFQPQVLAQLRYVLRNKQYKELFIVSEHGIEGTDRNACGVMQLSSGFLPWHRPDTASTSPGNVGRPGRRQVGRPDHPRSPPRVPCSLPGPGRHLRSPTPKRGAPSAM